MPRWIAHPWPYLDLDGPRGAPAAHDLDGNLARRNCSGADVRFFWLAEDRLDSIDVNSGSKAARLHYDALGRLVYVNTNQSGQDRYYIWDGDRLLREHNPADGTIAEYSWYGADRPHAVQRGGSWYWAHTDALGNVIAWTKASDKTVARTYAYDQWGNVIATTGSLSDGVRWKGAWAPLHRWTETADLYHLRARWYEGLTGRFISEDPIGLAGGINPYAFARADPVNGADPTGLQVTSEDCTPTSTSQPSGRPPLWSSRCRDLSGLWGRVRGPTEPSGHGSVLVIAGFSEATLAFLMDLAGGIKTADLIPDWIVPLGKCIQGRGTERVVMASVGIIEPAIVSAGSADIARRVALQQSEAAMRGALSWRGVSVAPGGYQGLQIMRTSRILMGASEGAALLGKASTVTGLVPLVFAGGYGFGALAACTVGL